MPASYRQAVEWIALEDEPTYLWADEILQESGVSVALVADLFGKAPDAVALAVQLVRVRIAAEGA